MKMNFKLKKPSKKFVVWAIIIVVILAFIALSISKMGKSIPSVANMSVAAVDKGDVPVVVSGSGVVEPISRRDIVPLVQGTITDSPFEEGDVVKAGDVLYRFDATDVQNTISQNQNSIAQSNMDIQSTQNEIEKLTVRASASGILSNFNLKSGDQIAQGKVADIVNNDNLVAKVPFNKAQYDKIQVGDSAVLTSAQYMTTLDGKVTYKADSTTPGSDGSVLYEVEITLANPGAFTSEVSVGATVYTSSGSVTAPASGKTENAVETAVYSEAAGKVQSVNVKNNQRVNKGDVLFTIENDSLYDNLEKAELSLRDKQLNLSSSEKKLDDYNITSPIDGVVITKNSKKGDNITAGVNTTVLMTVADTSKMVFNLEVDELDISKVQMEMLADVTADALPNETFIGRVTKIANEGKAENGVTTYTVEITIDQPGGLKSGMNVNADIVVEKAEQVLRIPISAIIRSEGDNAVVYVKDETIKKNDVRPKATQAAQGENTQIPAGFKEVQIITGLSNEDYIEVVSGLSEGQEVYNQVVESPNMLLPMMMGM